MLKPTVLPPRDGIRIPTQKFFDMLKTWKALTAYTYNRKNASIVIRFDANIVKTNYQAGSTTVIEEFAAQVPAETPFDVFLKQEDLARLFCLESDTLDIQQSEEFWTFSETCNKAISISIPRAVVPEVAWTTNVNIEGKLYPLPTDFATKVGIVEHVRCEPMSAKKHLEGVGVSFIDDEVVVAACNGERLTIAPRMENLPDDMEIYNIPGPVVEYIITHPSVCQFMRVTPKGLAGILTTNTSNLHWTTTQYAPYHKVMSPREKHCTFRRKDCIELIKKIRKVEQANELTLTITTDDMKLQTGNTSSQIPCDANHPTQLFVDSKFLEDALTCDKNPEVSIKYDTAPNQMIYVINNNTICVMMPLIN